MGRRAVRLRDRSNSIVLSRGQPWLEPGSRLGSAVGVVWDGVGCRWFGSLGIGVGWW